jgi:uncharacterized protein
MRLGFFMSEKNINDAVDLVVNSIVNQRKQFVQEVLGSANTKHSKCWQSYGYPESPTFKDFYSMYKRHGYAKAGVEVIPDKCWQSNPWFESKNKNLVKLLNDFAQRVNLWHNLKKLDYRQRVGQYAALLMIVADDKDLKEPMNGSYTLASVVDIMPYYQGEIYPSGEYDRETKSERYGLPIYYTLNENGLGDNNEGTATSREVHWSRLVVWAEGATGNSIFGDSCLEAGLNALINIEKINGAGGEGFWKNARTPMQLSAESGMSLQELATSYNKPINELADAINDKLKAFNTNLDSAWLTGGMKATPITANLPQPEQFLQGAKLEFAASVKIPLTILEGNQTGNQSSVENGSTFDEQCESRRANEINNFIMNRLVKWIYSHGMIKAKADDLEVEWESLIEPSPSEKLDAAMKMIEGNAKALGTGMVYFTVEEIRERAGYEGKPKQEPPTRKEDVEPEE